MKKIIILSAALVAIVGIAWFKGNERKFRLNRSATSIKLREFLFPEFDVNGIKKVHIKEESGDITLAVQNDAWVIHERNGYPLDKEKLQTALLSLKYEKIRAGRRIGKDSWGKVGVNAPGKTSASGTGILVELFDDKGALKYSLVVGGQVSSSGGSSGNDQVKMFGGGTQGNRFVRIENEDTIWEVGEQLPNLVTSPNQWVSKEFFDVQKVKSVEVTSPKAEDSWKASRAEESGEFVLEAAKPGEKLDTGKVSLATLLSNAAFNDVLSGSAAAAMMKDAVKVKIVTFTGFTYNLQTVKQAGQGGSDKYFLTVNVSAEIPKERPAVKDEKPEDKKKNDEAFAAEKKAMEDKLANEQKLAGWVYEVSEYTVSALLKKRAEILVPPEKKDAPPAGADPATGKPAGLPDIKKMIPGLSPSAPPVSVTTPPTQLPDPKLNPMPQEKPLAPANSDAIKPAPAPAPAAPSPAPAPAPAAPPAK